MQFKAKRDLDAPKQDRFAPLAQKAKFKAKTDRIRSNETLTRASKTGLVFNVSVSHL